MREGPECDLRIRSEAGGEPVWFGKVPADYGNGYVWLELTTEQLQLATSLYDAGQKICLGEVFVGEDFVGRVYGPFTIAGGRVCAGRLS